MVINNYDYNNDDNDALPVLVLTSSRRKSPLFQNKSTNNKMRVLK